MSKWDYYYPPRSKPRKPKTGIKARSKRGEFAATWWGKRWIEVLHSFHLGARLSRGRSYARGGQVASLEIREGEVEAAVQGSRPKPYDVSIRLQPITPQDWRKLGEVLSERVLLAAKLLAGELPSEVEQVFENAGLALFPQRANDLDTHCSCPDWSNPCKHIAAVYYLLAEEFDRDPFLLFRLRGMPREDFVALLNPEAMVSGSAGEAPEEAPAESAAEPLTLDPKSFWSGIGAGTEVLHELDLPDKPVALATRLGGFPFWRGESDFLETVTAACRQGSERGMAVFLGTGEQPFDETQDDDGQ